MTSSKKTIGIDVGGSHLTSALVDSQYASGKLLFRERADLNANDPALGLISTLAREINRIHAQEPEISSVGIAFPGPFDYKRGIVTVANVGGKFERSFGLQAKISLEELACLHRVPVRFFNDAHGFAAGVYHGCHLKSRRTVFLTLGTGFGSAFMENGEILGSHPDIPLSGAFFDQPYGGAKADDWFSTRWILESFRKKFGYSARSVKDLIEEWPAEASEIISEFGKHLGRFLLPWLTRFNCEELVIGGNIVKAFSLFGPAMQKELQSLAEKMTYMIVQDTEGNTIVGAALLAAKSEMSIDPVKRKSTQDILPLQRVGSVENGYDIYPTFFSGEKVFSGFDTLAAELINEKLVLIDGFGGVLWDTFVSQLQESLSGKYKKILWYDMRACMKPEWEIDAMIAAYLNGDDPVFGKRFNGELSDFFDADKLAMLSPDMQADLCIVYGAGAALTELKGKLYYVDIPKNEIQYRMRAGSITNLGAENAGDPKQMYKRFYFVDWPVFNRHKAQLLPDLAGIIDEQRITRITWMKGNSFRRTLQKMLANPFRARPWFESGIWGGDWMKNHFTQLFQDEINYAWSFELITPENGIVLEGEEAYLLEVSFDFLLYADNEKLLGKAAQRFGMEFPIRFDFLDTYNGGNLSIQCHPRTEYIREVFGENFTQDETYYILDCEPDANVYLGFQETIDPESFRNALQEAQENGVEMEVERFVQKFPSEKHGLYLIPNGTIHASGKNNLVLEISSTPYIFTFKMYDWLRTDLNDLPRPINIEHAFNNLYFDRKGAYVPEQLISHPFIEKEWTNGRKIKLPTHAEHFYTVDRYEFTGTISIPTGDQCLICMVVQGSGVKVASGSVSSVFHYAETFVVPAYAKQIELNTIKDEKTYLIVAYVKDEAC